VATEPDPHMLRGAGKAARKAEAKLSPRQAPAESLPLPSGSAATVVSTLVLCSVPDQAAVLTEVGRSSNPAAGCCWEHVRSSDPARHAPHPPRDRRGRPQAGRVSPTRRTEE
jgi:SAM-dependent methyltransferase